MKRNYYAPALMALVAAANLLIPAPANGQQAGGRATDATVKAKGPAVSGAAVKTVVKTVADDGTLSLPASDAVALIDMRRLLTEAVPRALVNDAARAAEVNADIEQFKTRTGIDARAFDRVAVGAQLTNPSANVTKIDNVVAIAHGTFDQAALVASGKLAAKGKHQEATYGGKTVHIFNINDRVKLFGLMPSIKVNDLALSVLDANTVAVGDPAGVRAAIDARDGRGRVSGELVALARRNVNAVIGFGGVVPPSLTKNLDLGSESIAQSIASIKQFYGSVGTSADGFDMLTVLRTGSAGDAKTLSDTLTSLKQLAPLFLAQFSGQRGKLAQSAVNSLKVTTEGSEVQLRLALAQSDIAQAVRVF